MADEKSHAEVLADEQLATFRREVEMTRQRHAMAVSGVHGDPKVVAGELAAAEKQYTDAGGKLGDLEVARAKETRPAGQGAERRALDDLKVAELKELAAAEGVDLSGLSKKDDLVAAIELAREEAAKGPHPDEPGVGA